MQALSNDTRYRVAVELYIMCTNLYMYVTLYRVFYMYLHILLHMPRLHHTGGQVETDEEEKVFVGTGK